MLAFVAMVLLAVVIWFVGPLLAVDGLRPLASVGVRVTFIVLLLTLGILWLIDGPISLVGVAALCLLVWHAGPLLTLGTAQPLATVGMRALIIGVILLVCALYWLYRLYQALRNNQNSLAKFLSFGKDEVKDDAAKEELKTVTSTVNRAVSQLKNLRGGSGVRRLFEGRRYLYELPWYMIVGSPGAGKTTALLNSGLQFPVAYQMGNAPKSMVLQSQGGTVHCDWWFTNEAVLIDTAGRYTTQDSNAAKDTAEWTGFLSLLRKHRTRAPINGVIVALSAFELLTLTDAERSEHAALVRDRLSELRQQLGIRFPVYVIVTKLDLLKGFGEYFQSLTSEGRTQTWGFTLPFQDLKNGSRLGAADIAGIRLFTLKQGIKAFASEGNIEIEAHSDGIDVTGLKDVDIVSSDDTVYITAKKKVLVNGGTSFSEWTAGGIKHGTLGNWTEHAAGHASPGPDVKPVPALPSVCWECMLRAIRRASAVAPQI